MGLSETILAAMIGALATVTTACFQLFSAFKSRKVDVRPKRGSAMRSVLAVLALMVASAGGGFLYSEFLKQRSGEDLRAMRQEVREMKDELRSMTTAATRAREGVRADESATREPTALDASFVAQPGEFNDPAGPAAHAESVVYVPACRKNATTTDAPTGVCGLADAQRIALCGTIPGYAKVHGIDLFAQPDAVQQPWDSHRVKLEQDLGGARFTGKSFEYAQGEDLKAVCVNFVHWSSDHPHIARIVVRYGFGETPTLEVKDGPADAVASEPTPTAIAGESPTKLPQAASLTPPTIAP